jgi:RNA polymerase sigma-70 factor (ECF subfamily)
MTRFPETHGSLVAAAAAGDSEARSRALGTLAEAYWAPVYTYIRFKAQRSHEEAADLTQEFFAGLVEKDWLSRFDPARARLRTYFRMLVDGLDANDWKARGRARRGGGARDLSLDVDAVRAAYEAAAASSQDSPEQAFEREWARSVFSMAVERYRAASAKDGREVRFALFAAYDLEGDAAPERPRYEDLARRHATTAVDVTNQLAAARRDFRRAVLDVLRELTASEAEFRAEARALLGVEPPA